MSGIRARVENGRLVVDEPTELAEGTVVDLVVDDDGDDLDDAERERLDAAIARAWSSIRAGHGRPASEVVSLLNSK